MYNYLEERKNIFTEDGQIMFIEIRDNVKKLLNTSGAFKLEKAISNVSGNSWLMIACVDRLVELGEIKEVKYGECTGQDRIFT